MFRFSDSQVNSQPQGQLEGSTVPDTTTSHGSTTPDTSSTSESSKKGRGNSHLPHFWNSGDPDKRLKVSLNDLSSIIGEDHAQLSTAFGVLARMGHLLPLNFEKWSDMPISRHDVVWNDVQKRASINSRNNKRKTLLHRAGRKPFSVIRESIMPIVGTVDQFDMFLTTLGTDGHGCVRCMVKGVTPTQFSGHSSTPDKDVIREEPRGELYDELRVEMQAEVAQSESKMRIQIEFLLSFLPLTARESFRTTFGDSSVVGFVHASGSQVHARENTDSFSEEVRGLAFGPMPHGRSYNACIVNNFRFRTKSRDERKATQNSVTMARRDDFDVYSRMYETEPYGNQVFDDRIPLNDDDANWVQDGVERTLVDVNDSEHYDEDEDCDEVD
ncbi:hypothetical protein BUALT_Bualt05G0065900 [Buddleja alternifolia]|uniref:Uncharacterized protein n=1 Tax=Buddleja alternifolia TaxID=168488 RepID=A0AAV6XQ81_9LAMI|nr:hypothetical protein BUALT_Bualt05G0065900 [Buddleja alternifolia]